MKTIILILIIILSACSQHDRKIILAEHSVIVAFGDSLTAGVGSSNGNDYPSVLAKKLGIKIINAGISGEDSYQALGRIDNVLETYYPQVVILLHGGNDILRKYDLTNTQQNLDKIIKKIKNFGAQVILIGVPIPKFGVLLTTANFYTKLAKQHQLLYLKDDLTNLFTDNQYKNDSIHLNDKGYNKLADTLAKYLKVIQ